MNTILTIIGFQSVSQTCNPDLFWETTFGLIVSGSICFCAAVNVLHPDIDDDLFDRVWYSCLAILMLVALLIGLSPDAHPRHIFQTLVLMMFFKYWFMLFQKLHLHKKE